MEGPEESEGMVREVRKRECNARAKTIRGISKDITDMGKYLKRNHF